MPGVTDLGAPPADTAAVLRPAPPPSPAARRLTSPRWRDGRLLAGVLLLLASVVVGARVLSSGERTSAVVSVASDLPAGHVLTAGDLTTARVRLTGATATAYIGGAARATLPGRVLARAVRSGELLAVAAVAEQGASPRRVVGVKVRDGRHPGLTSGDRVDVFATAALRPLPSAAAKAEQPGPGAAEAGGCTTVLVVGDVEVAADAPLDDPGSDLTLLLQVAPEQAAVLVHASETAALDVTLHVAPGDAPVTASAPAVTGVGGFASGACGAAR